MSFRPDLTDASDIDPHFGRALRPLWHLDDDLVYLNHGTVGATPKAVLAHQFELVAEIERHPAQFILRELSEQGSTIDSAKQIRRAAASVASFVGAHANDVVPVDNITTGANGVLRSITLSGGDEIVTTTLGYGGVTNAAIYVARSAGVTHRVIDLPLPGAPVDAYLEAVKQGLSSNTRLLVVDHITARTALVLPIREIVEAAHARGVDVFVDGAHVPGNIAVNIAEIGAEYYAANLHKWGMAPRSTGFLWVTPGRQEGIHSPITSWGLDCGITAEFDLPGTRDPSAFLTAPFALEYLAQLGGTGGVEGVYAYNHELAWWAGQYLSDQWGSAFTTPKAMIGAMVTVQMPAVLGDDADAAERVRSVLAAQRFEVPVMALAGRLWTRVSAQVYCERSDIEALAEAVKTLAVAR